MSLSSAPPDGTPPPSRLGWLSLLPFFLFLLAFRALLGGRLPYGFHVAWLSSRGVDLDFHIDGLSLLMVLLITGIGSCVFVYAAGYMAGDPRRVRLYVILLAFMAAMLGAVCADNLLVLFAFWEITSVTSFLLVGLKHEYEASRKSAQQALLITASGGLSLLAGVILLGQIAGTYSIQEIVHRAPAFQGHPLLFAALLCLFGGAFTKSAQFPFHFWLPNAMAAPTPVSAYLHSATMVKLGIYLLARIDAAFEANPFWEFTLVSCGGITSAWAMLQTLRERDLKRIFAWSTVSALGTMVMLIGLPGDDSATAVAALILAHALYKAPLFFVAGNIDYRAKTRSLDDLAGLAPHMPWTAGAALLAAASMSGFPLSFGHLAKELTNIAKREGDVYAWVGHASVMVSAFTVAVAAIAAIRIFWHRGGAAVPRHLKEVGWAMRFPPVLIAGIGILFGVQPHALDFLIGAAAEAMHPQFHFARASFVAAADPGWTALILALLLGGVVFFAWDRLHQMLELAKLPAVFRFAEWYERGLRTISAASSLSTRTLQRGALSSYTTWLLGFVTLCLAGALWLVLAEGHAGAWAGLFEFPPKGSALAMMGAAALVVVGAVAACTVKDSFILLLASGLVGLACALLFLFLGAPDLAFTQLVVEVAFVVVIASTLLRVRRLDLAPAGRRAPAFRAVFALALGLVSALLVIVAVNAGTFDPALARFFSERSVPDAHGRNVVNVVLVDFRALDTFGEIVVVFVSLLAVVPLLEMLRGGKGQAS